MPYDARKMRDLQAAFQAYDAACRRRDAAHRIFMEADTEAQGHFDRWMELQAELMGIARQKPEMKPAG